MPRIKFFGEGPDDVGKHEAENQDSSLQAIVKNIITKRIKRDVNFDYKAFHIKELKIHGGGFKRKAERAIENASREGFDAAVFVVDQDGDNERIRQLQEGRQNAQTKGLYFNMALGVAIRELEAWLLADQDIRRKHFGPKGGDDLGDIEALEHPKDKHFKRLCEILFKAQRFGNIPSRCELKLILAQESKPETIEKKCPKGFKPFRDEVEKNLVPLFA